MISGGVFKKKCESIFVCVAACVKGGSSGRAGILGAISRSEVQSQISSGKLVGVYYDSRAFDYLADASAMFCAMFRLT